MDLRWEGISLFFGSPGRFFTAAKIGDTGNRHFVFVAQNAANPYAGSQLIFRIANAFSDQILRLTDAAIAVDENAGVPEISGREHGNGHKRFGAAEHGKPVRGRE